MKVWHHFHVNVSYCLSVLIFPFSNVSYHSDILYSMMMLKCGKLFACVDSRTYIHRNECTRPNLVIHLGLLGRERAGPGPYQLWPLLLGVMGRVGHFLGQFMLVNESSISGVKLDLRSTTSCMSTCNFHSIKFFVNL